MKLELFTRLGEHFVLIGVFDHEYMDLSVV